jgi:fatty-acid desaturase
MTTFAIAFAFFYVWYAAGIAIGYHRLLSHHSFKCKKAFEYFWILGGYLAYQGSPIWWTSMHRAHHKHVDTEKDPHSPKFGLWKGYAGWIGPHTTVYPPHINPKVQCKDLYRDKLYVWLEQDSKLRQAIYLNILIAIAFHCTTSLLFGWQVGLAGLLASYVVFQMPLIVNTCCHIPKLGYKAFTVEGDDSVNVWWLGILAVGEGWHNNHHAYPGAGRAGLRPHEIDFSYMMIRLGKMLGLVTHINEPHALTKRLNRPRRQGALARFKRRKQLNRVG